MKFKHLIILLAIIFALPSFAQTPSNQENKRKEMMEFKLKFLGDEIQLNDSQRKQFDEVYTQMEMERRSIFKKIKAAEKLINENKNATEADYDRATKEISNAKSQMDQIEKKYAAKFSQFLSKKQIYKLKEAENKFNDTMRKCGNKKRHNK